MTNTLADRLTRVVLLLPPDMVEAMDETAKDDRQFWLFGKPSRSALAREAIAFFLAHIVSSEIENIEPETTICPTCGETMELEKVGKERMDPHSDFGPTRPIWGWVCREHDTPVVLPATAPTTNEEVGS